MVAITTNSKKLILTAAPFVLVNTTFTFSVPSASGAPTARDAPILVLIILVENKGGIATNKLKKPLLLPLITFVISHPLALPYGLNKRASVSKRIVSPGYVFTTTVKISV